ncbi:MAG: hypothetical protein ACREUQ_13740, partial [Burkholderiales bacterium]
AMLSQRPVERFEWNLFGVVYRKYADSQDPGLRPTLGHPTRSNQEHAHQYKQSMNSSLHNSSCVLIPAQGL